MYLRRVVLRWENLFETYVEMFVKMGLYLVHSFFSKNCMQHARVKQLARASAAAANTDADEQPGDEEPVIGGAADAGAGRANGPRAHACVETQAISKQSNDLFALTHSRSDGRADTPQNDHQEACLPHAPAATAQGVAQQQKHKREPRS